jgi:hypothetical protein
MSIERSVEVLVGFMMILSLLLTYFVHPGFVWMSVVVSVNVIQQALSGFCPVAMLLHKLGRKTEGELAVEALGPSLPA